MSTAAASLLKVESLDGLTVVKLQWPGIRGATELDTVAPLWDFFENERRNPSHVVLLCVPPEAVAPANLLALADGAGDCRHREAWGRALRLENILRRMVEAVRGSDALVVAVVQGEVALRMAAPFLACDYRIAGDQTRFLHTGSQVPIAPAGGLIWLLTRLIGAARTTDLVLAGRSISALEARDLGLVNHLATGPNVEEEALEVARRIATVPRPALRAFKRAMVSACEDLTVFYEREADHLAAMS